MRGISSENLSHLLTNLIGLVLVAVGLYTLVWVGWLTWYDITTWGKSLALIFFGSRTGEAISLGIGMKVIHYFLIGVILLTLSVALVKGYLGKIIHVVSRRVYLLSILLLSLHFVFLFLSIRAGDVLGSQPFVVRASVSSVFAFVLLSAAVVLLMWKSLTFQAEGTTIVALLSILVFFLQYALLHVFIGYTYMLLLISATVFTIIGLITSHIPKRTREARPCTNIERGSSRTKAEALPCGSIRKIWKDPPLLLTPVTLLVLVEELLLNSIYATIGLALALLALLFLPLSGAVLGRGEVRVQRFLEVSGLVFASRVVLSSFPMSFLASPTLLPAIYTLVLIACILYVGYRRIDLNYMRLASGETPILTQVLAGLLTGYVLGFIEYFVLRPTLPVTMSLIQTLIYLVVVMMVFVGITEEFLFRGLLQRTLEDMLPPWQAISIVSLIFALMHLGWLNPVEIIFAYAAGVAFGLLCYKTNSLITPIIAHGFGNVVLYTLVLFF